MQQAPPSLLELFINVLTYGLPWTLLLTILSLLIGFGIGVALALGRVYGPKEVQWVAKGYEKLFRGIPLLILLFLLAVASPIFFNIFGPGLPAIVAAATTALAIRSAAYQSQIFRGAILSVEEGQMQAARSIGMTDTQATRHIVLPQAFRLALPSWSNEYAVVIKDTSYALAVGVPEMVKVSYNLTVDYPAFFFTIMLVITVIYFLFTDPVTNFVGERMTKKLRTLGLGGR
ncbi:ABC transporter permease subunit [Candidatus Thorarchaeota archaeon]|nr:MAG: ABC transporter permease subunit [Candidatus Thorarchaeota archaeon]